MPIPTQRLVDAAPLALEAVCPAARRAAAKIEHANTPCYRSLHEAPIQQHVRSESALLLSREVDASVAEDAFDNSAPPEQVKMGPAFPFAHERIPLCRVTPIRPNP